MLWASGQTYSSDYASFDLALELASFLSFSLLPA
jgi:hypothetical protein